MAEDSSKQPLNLLEQGKEFCGHADTKTTLIYIGAGLDRQRTAQAALAKAFA